MHFVKIVTVILAFCVAMGTSMQLTGIKKFARGNPLPKPTTPPPNLHNYNILITKLEHKLSFGKYFGDKSILRIEMYNDTMPVGNGEIYVLQDLPANMQIQVTGYKYSMNNQWVVAFDQGRRLYCEYAETNVSFMQNFLKASNIKECPVKKGNYTLKNMKVDEKEFPPELPDSKFKIHVYISNDNEFLAMANVYADVKQKDED